MRRNGVTVIGEGEVCDGGGSEERVTGDGERQRG